ncbi:MAG: fibrobacter succinogenes major paralogous domain-containing protein [Cryomorphaceae bacterium]
MIYPIEIEAQTWQLTNLAVTSFSNGDEIPQAVSAEEWKIAAKEEKPAWCYFENRKDYGDKYGILYNWYAVNDERGLAPKGWWVPTKIDFDSLCSAIGCEDVPVKMKAKGEWIRNEGITNESGFAGLPAGSRTPNGEFINGGVLDPLLSNGLESTAWWTRDQSNKLKAYAYVLSHTGTWGIVDVKKGYGYSVRLLKSKH